MTVCIDLSGGNDELLIGLRSQPVAFVFRDCQIERAFDSLGRCRGVKQLLCTFEFSGIEPEVFLDDAALRCAHSFVPSDQFSRNAYRKKICERRTTVPEISYRAALSNGHVCGFQSESLG